MRAAARMLYYTSTLLHSTRQSLRRRHAIAHSALTPTCPSSSVASACPRVWQPVSRVSTRTYSGSAFLHQAHVRSRSETTHALHRSLIPASLRLHSGDSVVPQILHRSISPGGLIIGRLDDPPFPLAECALAPPCSSPPPSSLNTRVWGLAYVAEGGESSSRAYVPVGGYPGSRGY